MAAIETSEVDGVTYVRFKASRATLELPTYFDWCRLLVKRGAAVEFSDGFRQTHDGVMVPKLGYRLCEQHAELADDGNTALMRCISCATLFKPESFGSGYHGTVNYSKIRVGTIIRMEEEKQLSWDRIEVHVKRMPVNKTGVGCKTCFNLYEEEVGRINQSNILTERIITLQAQLKAAGHKILDKPPAMLTPWLDIHRLEQERAES